MDPVPLHPVPAGLHGDLARLADRALNLNRDLARLGAAVREQDRQIAALKAENEALTRQLKKSGEASRALAALRDLIDQQLNDDPSA